MGTLTSAKAKLMLQDGMAHGKKLTRRQKRFFGLIAGGGIPRKRKKHKKKKRY